MVQRGHAFAIVDEVDSILIDEARTPLIISGPLEDRADLYVAVVASRSASSPSRHRRGSDRCTSDAMSNFMLSRR